MSGPFGSSQWMYNSGADFYNGVATQSLRFDIASSSYLKRQPSASNRKTYVVSFWVKPSKDTLNSSFLAGRTGASGTYTILGFSASDNRIRVTDNQTSYPALETSGKYRDTSAWYHIVFAVDTTQTTTSNTIQVYVNGVKQSLATSYYYGTNDDTNINSTADHYIGHQAGVSNLDGYLAEYNFIDGLSFFSDTSGTPNTSFNINSFGELKNGVWIPIDYASAGSYGTNGFRLAFDSGDLNDGVSPITDPYGSATDVPVNGLADASGQGNHWTINGISAVDFTPDSPENNFPTINTLHMGSSYSATTTSEGALSFKHSNFAHASAIASMTLPKSGKWYWETLNNSNATSGTNTIGVVGSTYNNSEALSGAGSYFWANGFGIYGGAGQNFGASLGVTWDTSGSATSFTANDIIGVAYDADNKNIEWYKNGTLMDYNVTDFNDTDNDIMPASSAYGSPANAGIIFNFGQDPSFAGSITAGTETPSEGAGVFKHAVPSGYKALCTDNISDDDLPISPNADTQADDYFGTLTWSGDDNATRKIATGESAVTGTVDFTPDWSWIKRRNGSSNGSDHLLLDIVRGVDAFNGLASNGSQAEGLTEAGSTWFNFGDINNFEDGGFTVQKGTDPSHTLEGINQSGGTYVAWNWKAGGTAVSNADGTIPSSVSANTDAGFSIVTYTGSTSESVGHGLGVAPKAIFVKDRDASSSWAVYHQSVQDVTANGFLELNQSYAVQTGSNPRFLSGTAGTSQPTNLVFYVNNYSGSTTNNTGNDYIAYCFAEIEGYSKFGSYTGNGSTDGTFVYTGFRPAFVMAKVAVGATGGWNIFDNTRDPFNEVNIALLANLINADDTSTLQNDLDFVSNGFKIREDNNNFNGSGHTFIYMAFADGQPFKYANGR